MVKKSSSKKVTTASTCDSPKMSCESGFFYVLGIIGAAIHFISVVSGFWPTVLALLKSLVWPVFVVLKILGL